MNLAPVRCAIDGTSVAEVFPQLLSERLIATAPRSDSRIREAPGLFVVKGQQGDVN
jgi:hypothetical protein